MFVVQNQVLSSLSIFSLSILSKYFIQTVYPICEILSISLYPKSKFIQIFYPNILSISGSLSKIILSSLSKMFLIPYFIQIFYPKFYPFWAFYPKSVYPKFQTQLQYRLILESITQPKNRTDHKKYQFAVTEF